VQLLIWLGELELRGIAEWLMPEVASDPLGQLCQSPHLANDGSFEFVLAAGGQPAGHGLLQARIQSPQRPRSRRGQACDAPT
jgi:hypothetical protein